MKNMTTKAAMGYVETLHRRYGWPLKIHARGYDAYLVGAQPLLEGGPTPIYRFPGGNSLVDECEMLPASAENAARAADAAWAAADDAAAEREWQINHVIEVLDGLEEEAEQ